MHAALILTRLSRAAAARQHVVGVRRRAAQQAVGGAAIRAANRRRRLLASDRRPRSCRTRQADDRAAAATRSDSGSSSWLSGSHRSLLSHSACCRSWRQRRPPLACPQTLRSSVIVSSAARVCGRVSFAACVRSLSCARARHVVCAACAPVLRPGRVGVFLEREYFVFGSKRLPDRRASPHRTPERACVRSRSCAEPESYSSTRKTISRSNCVPAPVVCEHMAQPEKHI